jgi:histidine triad (HIT) family protein
MSDCPFCAIFSGLSVATTRIVRVTRYDMILEPLDPVTPGHLIVVPRRHVVDFAADPNVFAELAWVAAAHVRGLVEPGDWNLITSMGPAATRTVEHLHIHLIPRHLGDGLNLPWTERSP